MYKHVFEAPYPATGEFVRTFKENSDELKSLFKNINISPIGDLMPLQNPNGRPAHEVTFANKSDMMKAILYWP